MSGMPPETNAPLIREATGTTAHLSHAPAAATLATVVIMAC